MSREEIFEKARLALPAGSGETARWFVPGRIEVLGKHTDYAGGRSLLCCAERGFHVVARIRTDRRVRIADAARKLEVELELGREAPRPTGWVAYAAAVLRRIERNFPGPLQGADIAFASDLPRASGLSSSSALVVSLFTALAELNRLEERPAYRENVRSREDLAEYLGAVENGYAYRGLAAEEGVGTFGGSEDHTAILCCREGMLSRYSFCPVRPEGTVALPEGSTFVVAVSGVASDKTGSARNAYNRASLSARAVLELWNETTGRSDATLAAAATASADAADRIRDVLRHRKHPDFAQEALLARFDQFFEESERLVPAAAEAFARRDAVSLSRAVDRSQELAERLLRNQIPETVALMRRARHLGAVAASAFGGGFGGSVWALVPSVRADAFLAAWRENYRERFPSAAESSVFFRTGAGPAMSRA